jgi:hypothetical protein
VDKIFLNNELHPDLQNILPQDVIDKMLQFTPAQRIKFVEMIAKRNCYCVECSPTASACLCCNSNASLLGASGQARATLYYLIQYIFKDAVPLVHAVALAAAARRHIDTHPSLAEDCDSAERRTKYFVQRLTNSLTGLTEVSAPQAAASLMGLSSMVSTTHTTFCFIKGAMHFQDTLRLEGDEIMYENINDYLSYIMNDEITDVQDNDLRQDTDDNNELDMEITVSIDQPEDDNDDSSNIFDIDIADNIDQPEDDPDNDNDDSSNNEFDMDIADLIDPIEYDNDDFSVDAIALDGATPAITNLLIHGIIDQAGDMPMPPVCDNYERATDEFVIVYTVNGQRVPIEPYIHYRYRGQDPKMRCYAFIEFNCCIAIVKRPQQSEKYVSTSGGRPPKDVTSFNLHIQYMTSITRRFVPSNQLQYLLV